MRANARRTLTRLASKITNVSYLLNVCYLSKVSIKYLYYDEYSDVVEISFQRLHMRFQEVISRKPCVVAKVQFKFIIYE